MCWWWCWREPRTRSTSATLASWPTSSACSWPTSRSSMNRIHTAMPGRTRFTVALIIHLRRMPSVSRIRTGGGAQSSLEVTRRVGPRDSDDFGPHDDRQRDPRPPAQHRRSRTGAGAAAVGFGDGVAAADPLGAGVRTLVVLVDRRHARAADASRGAADGWGADPEQSRGDSRVAAVIGSARVRGRGPGVEPPPDLAAWQVAQRSRALPRRRRVDPGKADLVRTAQRCVHVKSFRMCRDAPSEPFYGALTDPFDFDLHISLMCTGASFVAAMR